MADLPDVFGYSEVPVLLFRPRPRLNASMKMKAIYTGEGVVFNACMVVVVIESVKF